MANENFKIRIDVLEKYIMKEAEHIKKLDEKELPAVLIELRQEEFEISDRSVQAKEINEISVKTIERVFECWQFDEFFEEWIDCMIIESA